MTLIYNIAASPLLQTYYMQNKSNNFCSRNTHKINQCFPGTEGRSLKMPPHSTCSFIFLYLLLLFSHSFYFRTDCADSVTVWWTGCFGELVCLRVRIDCIGPLSSAEKSCSVSDTNNVMMCPSTCLYGRTKVAEESERKRNKSEWPISGRRWALAVVRWTERSGVERRLYTGCLIAFFSPTHILTDGRETGRVSVSLPSHWQNTAKWKYTEMCQFKPSHQVVQEQPIITAVVTNRLYFTPIPAETKPY